MSTTVVLTPDSTRVPLALKSQKPGLNWLAGLGGTSLSRILGVAPAHSVRVYGSGSAAGICPFTVAPSVSGPPWSPGGTTNVPGTLSSCTW